MIAGAGRLRVHARMLQFGLLAVLLVAWESGIRHGWLAHLIPNPTFWFSSPSAIATLLWKLMESGRLASHVWLTLSATLVGLAIGALLGIATGLLMASSRTLEVACAPFWSALNALPKVALAPAFAAIFGFGISSKVALAVTLVFFVFLLATIAGVHAVSPTVLDNLRLMGARRTQILRMAVLPALAGWYFGALRISVGLALTAVIVGEFVAARGGIGFLIQYGSGTFNVTWSYAGILVLAALALILDGLLQFGHRRLIPWDKPA